MKKYLLPLLSLLACVSCSSNNQTSPVQSEVLSQNITTEEISSSETQVSIEDSSDIFDVSKYIQKDFFKVNDLYFNVDETYRLDLMKNDGVSLNNVNYLSSIPNNLSISDTGLIRAISNDTQEEVEGKIYVYDDTNYQEIDVHVVDKNEYGNYFMSVDIGRLYGKNVIFFGDSITHNWARYPGGNKESDNGSTSLGYNHIPILNSACHFNKLVNAAWSGGTMAYLYNHPERFVYKCFPGCVEDHIDDLKDMDYVFVFYGTNDLTEQVKIGTDFETMEYNQTSSASFKASMKYGIERIQEVAPKANMIFMNILYRTGDGVSIKRSQYNEAIDDFSKAYMIKLLDVSTLFTAANSYKYLKTDGLHPSETGYQAIANYILYGLEVDKNG